MTNSLQKRFLLGCCFLFWFLFLYGMVLFFSLLWLFLWEVVGCFFVSVSPWGIYAVLVTNSAFMVDCWDNSSFSLCFFGLWFLPAFYESPGDAFVGGVDWGWVVGGLYASPFFEHKTRKLGGFALSIKVILSGIGVAFILINWGVWIFGPSLEGNVSASYSEVDTLGLGGSEEKGLIFSGFGNLLWWGSFFFKGVSWFLFVLLISVVCLINWFFREYKGGGASFLLVRSLFRWLVLGSCWCWISLVTSEISPVVSVGEWLVSEALLLGWLCHQEYGGVKKP